MSQVWIKCEHIRNPFFQAATNTSGLAAWFRSRDRSSPSTPPQLLFRITLSSFVDPSEPVIGNANSEEDLARQLVSLTERVFRGDYSFYAGDPQVIAAAAAAVCTDLGVSGNATAVRSDDPFASFGCPYADSIYDGAKPMTKVIGTAARTRARSKVAAPSDELLQLSERFGIPLEQRVLPIALGGTHVWGFRFGAAAHLAELQLFSRSAEGDSSSVDFSGRVDEKLTIVPLDDLWIAADAFSQGNLRKAYYGQLRRVSAGSADTADPDLADVVVKIAMPSEHFPTGDQEAITGAYMADARAQMMASAFADAFNAHQPRAPRTVRVVPCQLLQLPVGGVHCLTRAAYHELAEPPSPQYVSCEGLITGSYEKWLTNVDFNNSLLRLRSTPHAFAHFSYWKSNGCRVCVDIQGVALADTDVYTDPQIHVADELAPIDVALGDWGDDGLKLFVQEHKCNALCKAMGLPPLNALSVIPQHLGTQPSLRTRTRIRTNAAARQARKEASAKAAQTSAPVASAGGSSSVVPAPATPTSCGAGDDAETVVRRAPAAKKAPPASVAFSAIVAETFNAPTFGSQHTYGSEAPTAPRDAPELPGNQPNSQSVVMAHFIPGEATTSSPQDHPSPAVRSAGGIVVAPLAERKESSGAPIRDSGSRTREPDRSPLVGVVVESPVQRSERGPDEELKTPPTAKRPLNPSYSYRLPPSSSATGAGARAAPSASPSAQVSPPREPRQHAVPGDSRHPMASGDRKVAPQNPKANPYAYNAHAPGYAKQPVPQHSGRVKPSSPAPAARPVTPPPRQAQPSRQGQPSAPSSRQGQPSARPVTPPPRQGQASRPTQSPVQSQQLRVSGDKKSKTDRVMRLIGLKSSK